MKLRNKFILWLAPVILLPFIFSLLFSLLVYENQEAESALNHIQTERQKVEDFFQYQINAAGSQLKLLSLDDRIPYFSSRSPLRNSQLSRPFFSFTPVYTQYLY